MLFGNISVVEIVKRRLIILITGKVKSQTLILNPFISITRTKQETCKRYHDVNSLNVTNTTQLL